MGHDEVSGPVQLTMCTFRGPQLPPDLRRLVGDLHNQRNQQVRLVDSLILQKSSDGIVTEQLISQLLRRTEAETALGTRTSPSDTYESGTGRGVFFRGERIPDPRDAVSPGFIALVLLVEHRWAAPLHDALLHSDASPVGNAWIGIDAIQEVGLMSPETANKLATA